MGLTDYLLGKKKIVTYHGLKNMAQVHDVKGLVEAMDSVDENLMPHLLEFLIVLSEKGRFDEMLVNGVMEKLRSILERGIWLEKKRAVILISTFIGHHRTDYIKLFELERDILALLPTDDDELAMNAAYIMAELCSAGRTEEVAANNGIEKLAASMESNDPWVHSYVIHSMQELTLRGHEEAILKTNLLTKLREDLNHERSDIANQARLLLNDLYNWKNTGAQWGEVMSHEEVVDEPQPTPPTGFESIGTTDGYSRPDTLKAPKAMKGKKKVYSSDGREVGMKEDLDTVDVRERTELHPYMKRWEKEHREAILRESGIPIPKRKSKVLLDEEEDDEDDDFVIEA
jgi:hypothetical protein